MPITSVKVLILDEREADVIDSLTPGERRRALLDACMQREEKRLADLKVMAVRESQDTPSPPVRAKAKDGDSNPRYVTGRQVGLSSEKQILIALRCIADHGGVAQMSDIYEAVTRELRGSVLSEGGQSGLRNYVNEVAVQKGYIYAHDKTNPGWRITPAGRERLRQA